MTHILHEPSAAATYYLKGALCELFDFLSSGFYVTPVHLSSSPESLLFLRISRLLEDTDGRLPRSELARLLNYNGSYLNSIVQRRTGLCLFDYGTTFCFQSRRTPLGNSTFHQRDRLTTQIYQPHPLLRTVPAKVRHDPATMA